MIVELPGWLSHPCRYTCITRWRPLRSASALAFALFFTPPSKCYSPPYWCRYDAAYMAGPTSGSKAPKPSDETLQKATLAQAQLMAPMYTQHLEPVGTPASRTSSSVKKGLAPLWSDITAHIRTLVDTNNTKGLDDIHGWFASRYADYVARKGDVSVNDTLDIMRATGFSPAESQHNTTQADIPPGQPRSSYKVRCKVIGTFQHHLQAIP